MAARKKVRRRRTPFSAEPAVLDRARKVPNVVAHRIGRYEDPTTAELTTVVPFDGPSMVLSVPSSTGESTHFVVVPAESEIP